MQIEELAIANFRGFCEERRVPMPANVVIIRGPNGSGKTSFVDAIQWLLLGDVQRFQAGALRPGEDYITNRYATGPPFVEACLLGGDGERVRVTRRGVGKSMQVQVDLPQQAPIVGQQAQQWLNSTMGSGLHGQEEVDFLRRYLLQQDDMREFLGADTKERYQFIASLSGMERLTNLEGQLRDELNATRKRVKGLKEDVEKAASELEVVSDSAAAAREDAKRHDETPGATEAEVRARQLFGQQIEDPLAHLRERSGEIAGMVEQIGELQRRETRLRTELKELKTDAPEKIAEIEANLEKLSESEESAAKQLADLDAALADARAVAGRAQQLAALALEQIKGPCPVCQQEHDAEQTRAHLQQLLAGAPGLADLTETVEQRRSEHGELKRRKAQLEAELTALRSTDERRRQAEDLLAEISSRTQAAQKALVGLLPTGVKEKGDPLQTAATAHEDLEKSAAQLQRAADSKARSRQAQRRSEALDKQRLASEERHQQLREGLSREEAVADQAKEARTALGLKITDVMREVSNASTGLINSIYTRLDIHPTFREFGFHTDRYHEVGHLRPWVFDRRREREGNALHVLSAAQLNSLAICLFLALNLERDSELRTAILDDPVQSLDDVNLLSLADLLRTVRGRRQVVVSTHDEVLAELLIRKLRPLREGDATAVVTIDQWGEAGPRVGSEMRTATGLEPEFQLLAEAGS
jgi:DNA repair exonuclease SbcCD ATPase subunit